MELESQQHWKHRGLFGSRFAFRSGKDEGWIDIYCSTQEADQCCSTPWLCPGARLRVWLELLMELPRNDGQ